LNKKTVRISLQDFCFYVWNPLQQINSLKPTDHKKVKYIKYYPIFKMLEYAGIIFACKKEAEGANESRLHCHVLNQEKGGKGLRT